MQCVEIRRDRGARCLIFVRMRRRCFTVGTLWRSADKPHINRLRQLFRIAVVEPRALLIHTVSLSACIAWWIATVRVQQSQEKRHHMSNEIYVASLTTCEVSSDGCYVRLNFEDALGRPTKLRLTSTGFQKLVMTLPQLLSRALQAQHGDDSVRAVFPLSRLRIERAAGSRDFILTVMTPDGFEVAFSLSAPAIAEITSALEATRSVAEQGATSLAS